MTRKTTLNKEIIECFCFGEQKRITIETQTLRKLWTKEHLRKQLNPSFPKTSLKMKKLV